MSPRRYQTQRRRSSAEQTRRRIVDAVIELHAVQGVTRTTYAMIAARADVAIPTVYNHFPTIGDLLAACTGDVLAGAPALGPQIFSAVADLEGRLRALAHGICAYYRHLAPWLRWSAHEAVLVPEIAARFERAAELRRRMVRLALEPAFGRSPPEPLLALCEILVDFWSWQRLARGNELTGEEVESILAGALLALAREYAATAGHAEAEAPVSLQRGRKRT